MTFKRLTPLFFNCIFLLLFSFGLHGQSNQYLHFDGEDDYTEFPEAAQYLDGLNTISMAGWFYTDNMGYGQGMMSIRGGGTGQGQMYMIQLNNGTIECRVQTSTGLHEFVAPEGTIVANEWQHYAWVFDQDQVRLFLNGELIGTGTASGNFSSSDRPFTIGKTLQAGFNFVFDGRADEVSLWSKALTQTEINNMINNELNGNEEDLVTYYKCDQGTPGGNNEGIEQLVSTVGIDRNANLVNFALTGDDSNFGGELQSGTQAINFPVLNNKLISAAPFELDATATSGLPVTFEVASGPATIAGNTLTLTGQAGEVTVVASQEGNETFDPATPVSNSFQVLDPATTLPEIQLLHPLAGDVHISSMMPVKVAVKSTIPYPGLFSVNGVQVNVGGEEIELEAREDGHFTGWWTPQDFGGAEMTISANNNFGNAQDQTATFNLTESTDNVTVNATDEVHVEGAVPTATVTADLPSFVGAYDHITGTLNITCPPGGCDPWDRISSIDVQGKNGKWYEIIRYLTPYGVACDHEIDLTDFMSLLGGKTAFRINLGTQGNGFEYTLDLSYEAGVPAHPYGHVKKLWNQTYPFGDPANLEPTEEIETSYPDGTQQAKIKLVSTGHGWGENNTNNAAEFSENTHHVWVNGVETFTQHNWNVCDPNPDDCSPQNGTWYYNRAGWCPGSIAPYFNYNMTPYITNGTVQLDYVFDEDYIDYCHPNNPDCISGTTCPNCNDGFNPHLIVTSYLISFGDAPLQELVGVETPPTASGFNLYPNPSAGRSIIEFDKGVGQAEVIVYDQLGKSIKKIQSNDPGGTVKLNVNTISSGMYIVVVKTGKGTSTRKWIIE